MARPRGAAPAASEPPAIDIVSRIQRLAGDLTTAERRVAEAVERDFEAATRMTIAELATAAGVSQPTVTRFCRSLGCASYAEFKIRLATTMTVAAAYLRSDRVFDDDVGQLAQTVTMRAVRAVRAGLDQLDTAALGRAIDTLAAARRIDIYGQGGGSAMVAEDAKLRLFRLGLPVAAYVDGHQQRMSAATLGPGDAVLAVSNSGRSKAVIEAVEIARSFGAATVAITRPRTALAAAAETVIAMTIPEEDNVLVPTPSRYAHLALVDMIATGVAGRLGPKSREALRRVRLTLVGIGVAVPAPASDPGPLIADTEPRE